MRVYFNNKSNNKYRSFIFHVSPDNPSQHLIDLEKKPFESIENFQFKTNSSELNVGNVNGITINTHVIFNKNNIKTDYFIWHDKDVWYGICYKKLFNNKIQTDISLNEVKNIILSMKYSNQLNNVDYITKAELSTEIAQLHIYNEEDLKNAINKINFNPKFPLSLNEKFKVTDAFINISPESNINKDINYELTMMYRMNNESIIFTQSKTSQIYNNFIKHGFFEIKNNIENKKVKPEILQINGLKIFKYENKFRPDDPYCMNYIWADNGIYYSIAFYMTKIDEEDILNKLINEKPIN